MAHLIQCTICKQKFCPEETPQEEWFKPSQKKYCHTKCYNEWKNADTHSDKEWIDLIYDFIARDLKQPYDYFMCEAQRKKFIKTNKYTNKGIYFALKYFYEVQKNDWDKGHGGIGIVPYVYDKSTVYWTKVETLKRGTMSAIERQIKERAERPIQHIRKTNKKKDKKKWDLNDI